MAENDPTDKYLRWALGSGPVERVLRDELLQRLPQDVVDVHSHANGPAAVQGLSEYGWQQVRSSFPTWGIDDTARIRSLLFGTATVRSLIMSQPYRGIDHRAANRYLLRTVAAGDRVTLCGLPDDDSYTLSEIASGRYVALKAYPHQSEPPYTRISEYFRPAAVAAAAVAGLPLILHLARPLSQCVDEVAELLEQTPDARIVLAHLGRETQVSNAVRGAFALVARWPGVTFDCSMATQPDVYRLTLETFGPDRLMYGSDTPMNLLRFVTFQHPERGHRWMSPHPYHWLDARMYAEYRHIAENAVLGHWRVLAALFAALDDVCGTAAGDASTRIFARNAESVFPHLCADVD